MHARIVKLLSAKHCYDFCAKLWFQLNIFSMVLVSITVAWIFTHVPADAQQGEVAKLMYIHVPSAVLSLGLFAVLGIMGITYLVFRVKVAIMLMRAILPIGLMLTTLVLITGAIWGKPTWGTYWIWDARLTSELILAFLYFALYTFDQAMLNQPNTPWILSILAIIGLIDLPIIHYSVTWWHTLHQGPSILAIQKPTIAWPMLWPLILMLIGLVSATSAIIMLRCMVIIRNSEKNTKWVNELEL